MKESAAEFRKMFFELEPPEVNAPKNEIDIYNFRSLSAQQMTNLVKSLQNIGAPVKREVVTVRGGC
jgi:hypothetical protein